MDDYDPIERCFARALAMFCGALTALAFLAILQGCSTRKTAQATAQASDTASVAVGRSWQRVAESVASWEADSIVVSGERSVFNGERLVVNDTLAGVDGGAGRRVVIYRPRAVAASSVAETASDSIAVETASHSESHSESEKRSTPPLWPCLAAAALLYVTATIVKKILKQMK